MTNSTLEAVLRRDRLVVAGAVGVIVALAWGYVLWLAADTDMGGIDMTGFRMMPAGMGIMAPANAPWRAIEFAFVFAMWAVMMVGMMGSERDPNLKSLEPGKQVKTITYCHDTYRVTTADGKIRPFWERNLRFMTDAGKDGPEKGAPASCRPEYWAIARR
jgi:hypothetical protein